MGIAGLLPQLRSVTRRVHVSVYADKTVAVDAYCLLHRGAYTCARELVEGEPTDRHVHYCMARIELMARAGVTPVVVFDGGPLPNKAGEERSRLRSREESKSRARQLWHQGNKAAAMECYQRAVDIMPIHAKQFVEALKRRGIKFIVAPYEADAQMAYLALNGLVDAVMTEDSDLLCYGCPRVFFKMDKAGEGEEVQLRELPQARELAFQGFGHDLFQEMCVLAGCDFVDSLPGIGIKKAHQHLRRTRCFLKVVRALRFDGTKIPPGYEQRVQRALWTFQHQRVYCPTRRAAVHLHEIAGGNLAAGARVPAAAQLVGGEPDFLGPPLPDHVAHAIAVGDLDPISQLPFGDDPLLAAAPAAGAGSRSGASVAGFSGKAAAGAGAGGNTLANYAGFFRVLPKLPAAAGFKPPRQPGSQPGSQDSSADGLQPQEQPQREQALPRAQQQGSLPASPQSGLAPTAAVADRLASPTEEQWESFRRGATQRRHRGSSRAAAPPPPTMLAAAANPQRGFAAKSLGPATSSYFAAEPSQEGDRALGTARAGGSLLSRLRAAVRPEPTVDYLLASHERAPSPSLTADSLDGTEPECAALGSFQQYVPVSQQLQQPPRTPSDLGLQPSPTVDDLLGALAGASPRTGQQPAQLGASPPGKLRASGRSWLPPPQKGSRLPVQHRVELLSPVGGLQQRHHQPDAGVTPGFYDASEAGSGARRPASLPRSVLAGTPPGSNPPWASQQHPDGGVRAGGSSDAVQLRPAFDGAELGSAGREGCDPIASLSHVAAFQGEAEAAVERAAQAALVAASHKPLRLLPPPPHLHGGSSAERSDVQGATLPPLGRSADTDGSSGCRQRPPAALVAARPAPIGLARRLSPQKENQGLLAGSNKRQKSASLAANRFASFACSGKG